MSSSSTSSSRFTFLATLFLLLFVSSAIILRSFILRRRFQRRVQEAIAAGILLSPEGGLVVRRKLEKPTLWDAFLVPSASAEWANIVPVAGRAAAIPSTYNPTSAPETTAPSRSRSWFPYFRPRPPAISAPTSPPDASQNIATSPGLSLQNGLVQMRAVQVTLLIAMPNPHRNTEVVGQAPSTKGKEKCLSGYWDEEDGVPDIVLGVTQVPYKHDNGLERVVIPVTMNVSSMLVVPA